jgi:hypothetical protein
MEECDHYGKAQNEHIRNSVSSLKMDTTLPSGKLIHSLADHIASIVNALISSRETTRQHARQNAHVVLEWAMAFPVNLKTTTYANVQTVTTFFATVDVIPVT